MHRRGSNNVSKPRQWIMYIRNIKNAKLTLFAFGMPPSCYQRGGNCFVLNSRAYYLVLYLSQGGISLIFILPLNWVLCNLSDSRVSCLILFSITEKEYIIQSLNLYFQPVLRSLRTILLHVNHGLSSVQDNVNISIGPCFPKSVLGNHRTKLNLFTSWGICRWCRTIKWHLVCSWEVGVRYHFRAPGSKTRSLVNLAVFKPCLGWNLWVKFAFLGPQLQQQWLWAGHEQVSWANATRSGEEAKVLSHRYQTHWLLGSKPLYCNHQQGFFYSLKSRGN